MQEMNEPKIMVDIQKLQNDKKELFLELKKLNEIKREFAKEKSTLADKILINHVWKLEMNKVLDKIVKIDELMRRK